ncbi:MAG TPA: hypothetical protein VKG25_21435, partial [Bryobacteraceae bacterium]|nr:hypothetical protein [Bryobacteraceae bacterium]
MKTGCDKLSFAFAMHRLTQLASIAALATLHLGAHDIPNDVTAQVFVKPAGRQMQLLIRVPLKAMRDIEFPKRGPGYLDLSRVDALLDDAAMLWISGDISIYEGDTRLPKPKLVRTQISLESDKSFTSFETALAHVMGPRLPVETNVFWNQPLLDVLFEYPIASGQSKFAIHPGLARLGLRVVTSLRFVPPNGAIRAFEFIGDPGVVPLDPGWLQAALRFVQLG